MRRLWRTARKEPKQAQDDPVGDRPGILDLDGEPIEVPAELPRTTCSTSTSSVAKRRWTVIRGTPREPRHVSRPGPLDPHPAELLVRGVEQAHGRLVVRVGVLDGAYPRQEGFARLAPPVVT